MVRNGPPIDRGWAWVIAGGLFVKSFITGGFVKSYGVFFSAFLETYGRSASETQLIRSARSICATIGGPIGTALSERFTERVIVMIGAFVMSLGFILAFFADSLEYMIFTFGICTGITCWTCPNKTNNLECNDWAPDRFCPSGSSVCQSVHRLHGVTGESIRVDKRCVSPEMCQRETVGCTFDLENRIKTCISCCSTPYCNEEVPHDNHTAITLSVTVMESGGCNNCFHWLILSLVTC